jgi:hypothetical protein
MDKGMGRWIEGWIQGCRRGWTEGWVEGWIQGGTERRIVLSCSGYHLFLAVLLSIVLLKVEK